MRIHSVFRMESEKRLLEGSLFFICKYRTLDFFPPQDLSLLLPLAV